MRIERTEWPPGQVVEEVVPLMRVRAVEKSLSLEACPWRPLLAHPPIPQSLNPQSNVVLGCPSASGWVTWYIVG